MIRLFFTAAILSVSQFCLSDSLDDFNHSKKIWEVVNKEIGSRCNDMSIPGAPGYTFSYDGKVIPYACIDNYKVDVVADNLLYSEFVVKVYLKNGVIINIKFLGAFTTFYETDCFTDYK